MCEIVIVSENTENTCFPCDGLRLHACVEIRATKNVAKLTQFLMWRCWANYSQEFPVFPYLSLLWYQSSCDPDPRCGILIIKNIILSPSNITTLIILRSSSLSAVQIQEQLRTTFSCDERKWIPSYLHVRMFLRYCVRMFWLWECF